MEYGLCDILTDDRCRICLLPKDYTEKISIFSEFKEGLSIAKIIGLLFNIHIDEKDKLNQICEKCLEGIESVHQIYRKVQENNVKYNLLCSNESDKVDILLEEEDDSVAINALDNFLVVEVKKEPFDNEFLDEDVLETEENQNHYSRRKRTLKRFHDEVYEKEVPKKRKCGKRLQAKKKSVVSKKEPKSIKVEQEIEIKTEVVEPSNDNEWDFLKSMLLETNILQSEINPDNEEIIEECEDQTVEMTYSDKAEEENPSFEEDKESDEEWKPTNDDSDCDWNERGTNSKKRKKRKRHGLSVKVHKKRYKPCHLCGKMVKEMWRHLFTHDTEGVNKKYICDICDKRFHHKEAIQVHMVTHSSERPFICDYEDCDRTFKNRMGLASHKLSFHIKKRTFACNLCDKSFNTYGILASHKKVHDGGNSSNKCAYCLKVFTRQPELIQHIKNEHADKNHIFFDCEECDMILVSKKKLNHHMQNVHIKKLQCHICGQRFHQQLALDSHSYKHQNQKPDFLKCQDCGKVFSSRIALNRHVLKHTNTILHNCEVCGKGYTRLDSYKVHMKGHVK